MSFRALQAILFAIVSCIWLIVAFPAPPAWSQAAKVDEVFVYEAAQAIHREAENWWRDRHQAKKALKDQMERVDLVFIGDSITHSWENKGKATWEKLYAPRHALNLGYSGDRTEHVIWRLRNGEVDHISPKLVVVMIGTNNTGHRMDKPPATAEGIKVIVNELKERLPESKILLLGIFPRDPKARSPKRKNNDQINELISQYADGETVHYLNINQHFLNDAGDLSKDIMPDYLHPNAQGYEIWGDAMEPKVKTLMGED